MSCHGSGFRNDEVNRKMGQRSFFEDLWLERSPLRRGSRSYSVAFPAITRLKEAENGYPHGSPSIPLPNARTGEPDERSGPQRQRLGQTTRSTVTTHQKTVPAEMSGATASQLPIAPPPFGVNRILPTAVAVGCVRESRTRRPRGPAERAGNEVASDPT